MNKTLLAAALALGVSAGAQASNITVGGITWDPDSAQDLAGFASLIHQDVDAATGELSGFGVVSSINGNSNLCADCDLFFNFSGLLPVGGVALPNAGSSITYNGGGIDFYVSQGSVIDTGNLATLTPAATTPGVGDVLWLSTTFSTDFLGTVQGNFLNLSGLGFLDVTGGAAGGNFNTNTLLDATGDVADIGFTTSFSINVSQLSADGNGNFQGDTIPEPASLALIGLGLLGAGIASRKKAKA